MLTYGNYDTNPGPIDVLAIDQAGAVTTLLDDLPTEQINRYRTLNDGAVWTYSLDPVGDALPFLATNRSGSWEVIEFQPDGVPTAIHLFDVAQEPNDDLYACGSRYPDAAMIWRSTDGGATCSEVIAVTPGTGARFVQFRRSAGQLVASTNYGTHYALSSDGSWSPIESPSLDPETPDVWVTASSRLMHSVLGDLGRLSGSYAWSASLGPDGTIWLSNGESIYTYGAS